MSTINETVKQEWIHDFPASQSTSLTLKMLPSAGGNIVDPHMSANAIISTQWISASIVGGVFPCQTYVRIFFEEKPRIKHKNIPAKCNIILHWNCFKRICPS